ncbi:hypothetical protein AbraIFM66951_009149 [Aspergillus brasiliensis]|uniref:Uncharacterized protein n=1 Tax=Aspergillus brasiliensis TaxID=319629 RepID=A0A9W6DQE3_9EURO|nr:hypothetical protein AbraCBS73388_010519 [Aspergillus brasiliensis]GKZ46238.1 hypothetical protein AbraIFM66951_009149 [Aspergillus brasiliensis]
MTSPLAIPVKLDAFVFNEDTCNGTSQKQAKVAPLQQPNYSFMRMKDSMARSDVMSPVDLHAAAPAKTNSRITNLATSQVRKSRLGVYLHWMIPRPYRSGKAATKDDEKAPKGADPQMPVFPECPNRWLVIRKVVGETQPPNVLPAVQAWVVYSDWMRTIDKLDDTDDRPLDLQVDVSPYLSTRSNQTNQPPSIDQQAEVFIGGRSNATKKDYEKPRDRVSLTVLNSSNQLFPDYQPHNGNVFSMLDNFEYDNGKSHATHVVANYFVLGWHDNKANDLLKLSAGTRGELLRILSMQIPNEKEELIQDWLNSTKSEQSLCHGAMYGVNWASRWTESNRPTVLADQAAQAMADSTKSPVSLGTTPLDALLAYVASHAGDTEQKLKQLGALLRAQNESIEDRRAGLDEVQNYNFEKTTGGTRYVLRSNPNGAAQPPSCEAINRLQTLNQAQQLQDAISRQLKQSQWNLFAIWWRYLTDLKRDSKTEKDSYTKQVDEAKAELAQLNTLYQNQLTAVQTAKDKVGDLKIELKAATEPDFTQQRDPTLFVGEVKAGWPIDYLDALQVRLGPQIADYNSQPIPDTYGLECVPDDLRGVATRLVNEFNHYASTADYRGILDTQTVPPLYHKDQRDQWQNTQPWFPLFLEWEAQYFHIPDDQWEMQDISTHPSDDKKFSYKVKQDKGPLWETPNENRRTLSGRILLLPQPVFSLHAQVERLFETVSDEVLKKIIPKGQRDQLLQKIRALPFISAPLSGFTNHLTTRVSGAHVKPTVRYPGKEPVPLAEAAADSQKVHLDTDALQKVGVETDLTPYGSLERLGELNHPAFKSVTHGQFRLTKLNIIDKFGQAVPAIDPKPRVGEPASLNPHIAEYYRPQSYKDGFPNIIVKPPTNAECPFVQVPPSINQPARLHMNWVKLYNPNDKTCGTQGKTPGSGAAAYKWRPITEWENPIWGWVVVNYVNYGVQFFLPDGRFYREVRVASPNNPNPGAVAGDKWLPFKPPQEGDPKLQLDKLIKQFTSNQTYLLNFMTMINSAVAKARPVPGPYSQCINSLVGRPLALANAGFSLELAENALRNQSTADKQPDLLPPKVLLPDPDHPRIPQYEFPVKLGDSVRPHDGLVGYFPAKATPVPEDELHLDNIYTPFPNDPGHVKPIDPDSFLRLKPFWLNPVDYITGQKTPGNSKKYIRDREEKLMVYGMLVDPFTPVNAYSSILPVETLRLAPWTWESALQQMTAFFHCGPLVVEDDVPQFEPGTELRQDYDLEKNTKKEVIKLPALAAAEWSWLQPYMGGDTQVTEAEQGDGQEAFVALSLGKVDPVPQFGPGPLTAVEGYLQMKRPITAPDQQAPNK